MRRDHFTLTTANTDPDRTGEPTLIISYDGPAGNLTARLESDGGTIPASEDIDAAFRLQTPLDDANATGVFSLTRRITGGYFLEVNAAAERVLAVIDAARDDSGHYRVRIERPGADDIVFRLTTLLVYDEGGSLRRQHSLIPGGVEL